MNNKTKKIISIILLLMIVMLFVVPTVYAAGDPLSGVGPNIGGAGANVQDKVKNAGNGILGIIQIVGSIVAIAMILFLGMKYMIAAPEEKAQIKKSTTIYILGAVFLFAATNLVTMIANFAIDVTQ